MTRAVAMLFTFRFREAWYYHPMVFFLPLGIALYVYLWRKQKDKACNRLVILAAVLFIGVYIIRFLYSDGTVVGTFTPGIVQFFEKLFKGVSS